MNDVLFKIETYTVYKGMTYVILFAPSGYRRCYIGIPKDKWYDDIVRLKFNKIITVGDKLLKKQCPNLAALSYDINWICFCCNMLDDRPSFDAFAKYYPNLINTEVGEAVKNTESVKSLQTYRTFEFCEEECRTMIDRIEYNSKFNIF